MFGFACDDTRRVDAAADRIVAQNSGTIEQGSI